MLIQHLMAAAHISVVREKDHNGVILLTGTLQRIQNLSDGLVQLTDHSVITGHHVTKILFPVHGIRAPA